MPLKKAARLLPLVMMLLLTIALTACSQQRVILQGQQAVKLQQNESAPWPGWLIQDETLARILEQAEACQAQKGN
jgi:hypothetical protein